MIVIVKYCKHMRRDGTFNTCAIDTVRGIYCNDHHISGSNGEPYSFVEARISGDVDSVRSCAIKDGYREVGYDEFRRKGKTA